MFSNAQDALTMSRTQRIMQGLGKLPKEREIPKHRTRGVMNDTSEKLLAAQGINVLSVRDVKHL